MASKAIAVTAKEGRPKFEKRERANICFCCRSEQDRDNLTKCRDKKCDVSFHEVCYNAYKVGGFNAAKMADWAAKPFLCSRHYCTYCYGNGLKTRAFYGSKFISCAQCELAWHPKCIPAGCDLDENEEIICPRHRIFPRFAPHTKHCASCQESDKESLLKCRSCVRSVHFACAELNPDITEDLVDKWAFTCQWCRDFVFVTENQYCMGYFTNTGLPYTYYPCVPVPNSDYPAKKKDARLGNPGYVLVKWMMYEGKQTYSVLSHSKIVEMNEKDYFFITGINSKGCDASLQEPWREAQRSLADPKSRMLLREDQKPLKEQEPMNKVKHLNYFVRQNEDGSFVKTIIPVSYKRTKEQEYCRCSTDRPERCAPGSGCDNREDGRECPKDCGGASSVCLNQVIQNSKKGGFGGIEVFDTVACGKGVRAVETIAVGTFIGEYHGEIITKAEAERRIEQTYKDGNHEEGSYILDMDGCYVDAKKVGSIIRYVNHSCSPNCEMKPVEVNGTIRFALFAQKEIAIGEELTFDYKMEAIIEDARTLPDCYCGAEGCSGVLGYAKSQKKSASRESPPDRKKRV
ncbi:hypothetical protein QR680_004316 [Steinernema hermaphroditum]|uniref:Histone-lysine N-methyltransferase n=1 Tax=Steinernema hermaphroditum TaxID=289476 RepID=A0AA39HNC4_9BILA|nr:hypothetical protein QR680_004316 [Steinernema hermaphroditum]